MTAPATAHHTLPQSNGARPQSAKTTAAPRHPAHSNAYEVTPS